MTSRQIPYVAGIAVCLAMTSAAPAAESRLDARALREAARREASARPSLERWHTFVDVAKEGLVFDPGPQAGVLEPAKGRWDEQSAIHVVHGMLKGEPRNLSATGSTVCFWIRVRDWEKVDREGYKRDNGGVMAVGSGWYDGWRIVVTPGSGTLSLGLGSAADDSRTFVSAPGCLRSGAWHHVAATWDGQRLRLHVDGNLQAEGAAAIPYTAPKVGPNQLRLGECGYGVGVLDFDLAELGFFAEVLPDDLIRRLGDPLSELTARLSQQLAEASTLAPDGKPETEAALRERNLRLLEVVVDDDNRAILDNVRSLARLNLADSFRREQRYDEARQEYGRLADAADAPPHYRAQAQFAKADTRRDQRRYGEARSEYEALRAAFTGKHEHYRVEALDRLADVDGLAEGEPFRDLRARRIERLARPQPAFYLAPTGDDANPGTQQRPFQTLERSRDALRALKAAGPLPDGGVAVVLAAGVYPRTQSFTLGAEDSGTASAPILYRAAPGATAILRGGRAVTDFAPLTHPLGLKRIPAAAQPHILQADLKAAGITELGTFHRRGYGSPADKPAHLELFFKNRPMPLAQWPNETMKLTERFTTVKDVIGEKMGDFVGKAIDQTNGFIYGDPRHATWSEEPEVCLLGYWTRMYAATYLKVASIEPDKKILRVQAPLPPYGGFIQGAPYYAVNLLCELDAPGEWYVDKPSSMLFFWPPEPPQAGEVVVSLLESPLLAVTAASHLAFRGLTLEAGRLHGAVISGGEDVILAGCVIRNVGVTGVRIEGGRDHVLVGCDIEYPGDGGVSLRGGEVKTLTPSGHRVENCHIHHFDRWNRSGYQAGVIQAGVGTRVSHCLIHDGPQQAFLVTENDHILEYTEIHDTCHEAGEMGSYYMYGDRRVLGERGQLVRFNYWHDLPWNETYSSFAYTGRHALHVDHMNGDITLYGNFFQRCYTKSGVFFSGGPDNTVENNVFQDCSLGIDLADRSWVYEKANTAPGFALDRYLEEMKVDQPPWSLRYPHLRQYPKQAKDMTAFLTGNVIARNLAVQCGQFLGGAQKTHDLSRIEHNWRGRDPGFKNAPGSDFNLRPAAPVVVADGFEPLPLERIGLYQDELRATWPVLHPAGNHENLLVSARHLQKDHPVCQVRSRQAPITIDGTLTPAEWGGLDRKDAIALLRNPEDVPGKSLPSYVWVQRDHDFLYLALLHEVNPSVPLQMAESWWARDMAEIIIEGKSGVGTGGWWLDEKPHGPLFYLLVDFQGNFDSISIDELPPAQANRLRQAVQYSATVPDKGQWTAEWRIPIALLCLDPDQTASCNLNIGVHKLGGNPRLPAATKLSDNDQWIVWSGCAGPNWQVWNAGRLLLKTP
jgi:hypothetical protein